MTVTGLLLLDDDFGLELADRRAAHLLGAEDAGELARWWKRQRPRFAAALSGLDTGGGEEHRIEVPSAADEEGGDDAAPGGPLEGRAMARPDGGWALRIAPSGFGDALTEDLILAARGRALARVSTGVFHDLRSPLNALSLNVELLRSFAGDAEKQERAIGVIVSEMERLKGGVERVASELEVPEEERVVRPVDLAGLVRELAEVLRSQVRREHVELDLSLPEGPAPVCADRHRLRTLVLCLVVNSLEALQPDGGRLEVSVENRRTGEVRLAVTDDGPGFPEGVEERPGELGRSTRGRSGAGLFAVRTLTEALGGSLAARAEPNGGARVRMDFPAADPA